LISFSLRPVLFSLQLRTSSSLRLFGPLNKEASLQQDIRECRKELVEAVAHRQRMNAARAAVQLYQLTHPSPPALKRKGKGTAKDTSETKDEDDLPLSELMKLHPPLVKLEEQDADSTAVVSGKKRKRVSKQQPPLRPQKDSSEEEAAANHSASSTRKVRHNDPTCRITMAGSCAILAHFAPLLVDAVFDCQSKRHKRASLSQDKHATAHERGNSAEDDDEEGGCVAAATTANSSRRPPRRAAAEAMQKLHVQSARGRHRRGQNLSEERKEASADSDSSEDEDRSAARAAARSIRHSRKQHDASAAASTASFSRAQDDSKRHARESRGFTHAGAESEANQDGSSSEAAEEESGSSSARSELSEVDEDADEEMRS
jgi:hypothetical protein